MGTSVYTSLLTKDYRRKLGDVVSLRRELRDLCHLIREREAHVAALHAILIGRDPDFDAKAIKPVRTKPRVTTLKHSTLTRSILDCLREAKGEVIRKDHLVQWVIERRGIAINTRADWVLVSVAVKHALKRLNNAGRVVRHHDPASNQFGSWSLPARGQTTR